ncbi:MAG: hypothetical protein ACO260_05250 [Hylemonella sp.]|jgi:uncharacterized protein YodC (DUF2158 family)
MAFKIGDTVKVKAVVPQGPVQRMRMDETTGEISYLVEWVDIEGHTQQRWFTEAELTGA